MRELPFVPKTGTRNRPRHSDAHQEARRKGAASGDARRKEREVLDRVSKWLSKSRSMRRRRPTPALAMGRS
jgi:hypothetical protein